MYRFRHLVSDHSIRASAFLRALVTGFVCAALLASVGSAVAKRAAPAAVEPVTVGRVSYSAPQEQMGFVLATDTRSHRELWRQRIYGVHVDPTLERDVQDVFITSLELRHGKLIITNERGERFSLSLSTRKVTRESDRNT